MLTVFFEDPFWVGVFEKQHEGSISVARHVFGGEPTDTEVYHFILTRYWDVKYSSPAEGVLEERKPANPKRLQREAAKLMKQKGISTQSQELMRLEREKNKQQRQSVSKVQRDAEALEMFRLKQEKKREKHKGH